MKNQDGLKRELADFHNQEETESPLVTFHFELTKKVLVSECVAKRSDVSTVIHEYLKTLHPEVVDHTTRIEVTFIHDGDTYEVVAIRGEELEECEDCGKVIIKCKPEVN